MDENESEELSGFAAMAMASVERELAEMEAAFGPLEPGVPSGSRVGDRRAANSSSVVFTVRLGHPEFEGLRRQAAFRQIPPSALARSFIRVGLTRPMPSARDELLDEVARLVTELSSATTRLQQASTSAD